MARQLLNEANAHTMSTMNYAGRPGGLVVTLECYYTSVDP